ncbi:MAG: tRNA (adenosine(37)-N6)-threonylcarbamoyltransferase complex transferase subunit TsaD [Sphingobacteriaceae bacterium]|nr:tRNA (adenosine(37)-N6)-threonylcarbamoyltransferase complex transferase subunit TsaD [Sphingobacteriaceae bacterium]
MKSDKVYILGIESSCDDTSCAILQNEVLLSNITANQKIHEQYGGVIPELASRDHQKNIVPTVHAALEKAGVNLSQISAIAFTRGPGLMGSLLVGTSFAKSLSMGLGIPLIEVNHMQAHILAHFIQLGVGSSELVDKKLNTQSTNYELRTPNFPFLCLTVSGGHTQIVKVKDHLTFELLGETQDDAVGEAFDKAAKILGLPYPGGPLIDKYAQTGNPNKFSFSKSKVPNLDYSFSGIKTSFLYFIQNAIKENQKFIEENLNDICASYQNHLVKTLLHNLVEASKIHNINQISIAGGVSANSELRKQLKETGEKLKWDVFIPPFEFCTDNAAMIAITGYYKFLKKDFCDLSAVPQARYTL